MRATLKGELVTDMPFGPWSCTGYKCDDISITSKDVEYMRLTALNDPQGFQTLMYQLELRFMDRRPPVS